MTRTGPPAPRPPSTAAGPMPPLVDPERALAVSYAPARLRPALATLFALDERLGSVVGTTGEAGIGLIRLAWWREALTALDATPAPPEPLLALLGAELLPRGIAGADLAELEDGWAALLDGPVDADALVRHARGRGRTLFALAARLLGADVSAAGAAGEGWALADLAHRHSDAGVRAAARALAAARLAAAPRRWSRATRPLGALAALARADAAADARRQGSPARVARMLALQLFGA